MSFFSWHAPFEVLIDCAEGKLSQSQEQDVIKHLSVCDSCSSQMNKLKAFIDLSLYRITEKPTQATSNICLNIFTQEGLARKKSLVQRLFATLVFDDWQTPYAASERYSNFDGRQFLYRAEEFDLDLRVVPVEGLWSIAGQVLGKCKSGYINFQSETVIEKVVLNEACEFLLPNVPDGNYTMTAFLDEVEIEIPNIILPF